MDINVSWDKIRERGLFVATPMYGGMCYGSYTHSMMSLSNLCQAHGIPFTFYPLFNESLIQRARSYSADEFLRSPHQSMLFIDSDISFDPNHVIEMLAIQTMDDETYDIVSAVYPKKCITWEKIKVAVDKGFAEENPDDLAHFVGDFVFNPKNGNSIDIREPAEVLETGTGFMMISRKAFQKFDTHFGDTYKYLPDHVRTQHFDGSREISLYFQSEIDPKSRRYLSEDYWFCQKLQEAGGKIWICPWMNLQHTGTYTFAGSLQAMAAIQVSPTADVAQLKKNK